MENYSKMYQAENATSATETIVKPEQIPVEQPVIETVATPEPDPVIPEPEIPQPTIGVVVNCTKLNVREKPDAQANVVCVLVALDEVQIEEEESTEDFYKVCTVSGLEGFCMRKYIVIREE